jgi:hypothetical protein
MGSGSSKLNSDYEDISYSVYTNEEMDKDLNTAELELKKISEISIALAEQYHKEFLRPDFCNRIALVSKRKLGNYSEQELENMSYTLGIVAEDPKMKENLCEMISEHYMKRVNLISTILSSLDECSDRVKALTSGPICLSNPDVFEEDECKKIGGNDSWLENYNISFGVNDQSPHNKPFFDKIKEMNTTFIKNLQNVNSILNDLKREEYQITPENLDELQEKTQKALFVMKEECRRLYYDALLNPPLTDQEISIMNKNQTLENEIERQTKALESETTRQAEEVKNDINSIIVTNIVKNP